jgi:uncharacterized membrane protein
MQFGFLLLILGIILTLLGILGVFIINDDSPKYLKDLNDSVGNWIYWCILVGPVVIIAGAWYFFDNRQKRKEFKELMETTSKAKFIRNMDRAEFLAWKLTVDHQKQLIEKKKELHIKK